MRRLLVPVIAMIVAGALPAMAGDGKPGGDLPELANIETGPTMLNDHVVVDTRVVRLGDLFTNAEISTIRPMVPMARPPFTGPIQTWNMR